MDLQENYSYKSEFLYNSQISDDIINIWIDFTIIKKKADLILALDHIAKKNDIGYILYAVQKNLMHRIKYDIAMNCHIILEMDNTKYGVAIGPNGLNPSSGEFDFTLCEIR